MGSGGRDCGGGGPPDRALTMESVLTGGVTCPAAIQAESIKNEIIMFTFVCKLWFKVCLKGYDFYYFVIETSNLTLFQIR